MKTKIKLCKYLFNIHEATEPSVLPYMGWVRAGKKKREKKKRERSWPQLALDLTSLCAQHGDYTQNRPHTGPRVRPTLAVLKQGDICGRGVRHALYVGRWARPGWLSETWSLCHNNQYCHPHHPPHHTTYTHCHRHPQPAPHPRGPSAESAAGQYYTLTSLRDQQWAAAVCT